MDDDLAQPPPAAGPAIGRMESPDWERVREIRLRALGDAPDAFGSTLAEESAFPPAMWRARLEDPAGATFVATAEGRDVGLAVGRPWEGREGDAGLFSMWVDPESRGRGIGDALVDAVVAWARAGDYRRLLLDVADGNHPAIRLYERKGFLPTGETGSMGPERPHILEHRRALDL